MPTIPPMPDSPSIPDAAGASSVPPGRIFPDSVNLYDDQAKVAFDYLRKAAEKIIAEEDQINAKRRDAESALQRLSGEHSQKKTGAIICFVLAVIALLGLLAAEEPPAALIISGILAIVGGVFAAKASGIGKEEARTKTILRNLDENFRAIRRDYSIDKLGVAYVPVATSVPFEDKSFVLDDTASVAETEFALYQMNDQAEFLSTLDEIRATRNDLPLVEEGSMPEEVTTDQLSGSLRSVRLHDTIGALDRNLRSVAFLLNDLSKTSVSLPVIDPSGPYAAFLRESCAEDVGSLPVLGVFGERMYARELARFEEMNQVRRRMAEENTKLERMLQDFIVEITDRVQTLSQAKLTSANHIVDFSNRLLLNAFKASYNHYSPLLEAEAIKRLQETDFDYKSGEGSYRPLSLSPASRVRFDAISGNWVADDGSRTSHPFGIHQIQEEVIAPLVQNLLQETRVERLAIYTDIIKQKRDYLDRWNREVNDFFGRGRTDSGAIINQMEPMMADLSAAASHYEALDKTNKEMEHAGANLDATKVKTSGTALAFSIRYCEEQNAQIQKQKDEFEDFMNRLTEDIARRAKRFDYTKFYEAALRDGHAKEVASAMEVEDSLDERQKALLGANAYLAAPAQLPPPPAISDGVYQMLGTDLRQVAADALVKMAHDDESGADLPDFVPPPRLSPPPTPPMDDPEDSGASDVGGPDLPSPVPENPAAASDESVPVPPPLPPIPESDESRNEPTNEKDGSIDETPPMAEAPNADEPAAVADAYAVILDSLEDESRKTDLIRAVRDVTGLGLWSAKSLIENAPSPIRNGVTRTVAEEISASLERAGARVHIEAAIAEEPPPADGEGGETGSSDDGTP